MKKIDLIDAISSKTNLNKTESRKALDCFIEIVTKQLAKGDNVRISGLGTFKVTQRAARKGIIPSTKAVINIPAKKVAKFNVAKELADAVNK